jgi:tetratricopeptide (TPR) repeat protein
MLEGNDPEDLNIKVKLGLVYMEMKNLDKATSIFKTILEKNPTSDRVHYYLGSIYENLDQVDNTIKELKLIQPTFRLYKDVVLHTAFLLEKQQLLSEAKEYLKDAITKVPRVSEFHLFQAHLEEQAGNITPAITLLEAALESFPEDEKLHYYLGTLYDRQGTYEKSIKEMERIIQFNPQHVDALNYLGYTWTVKGVRLQDAEIVLRRALKLSPKNAYVKDSWGWYLFVRGKLKEAVIELEKAALLMPSEPTILEHLGDAYLSINLKEKAVTQYLNARKNSTNDDSKKKIQIKLDSLTKD